MKIEITEIIYKDKFTIKSFFEDLYDEFCIFFTNINIFNNVKYNIKKEYKKAKIEF